MEPGMVDLFEALDEGVVLVDSECGVVFVNRAALKWKTLVDATGELSSWHASAMVAQLVAGTLGDGAEVLLGDVCGPGGEQISATVHHFGNDGHVALVFRLEPSGNAAGARDECLRKRAAVPVGTALLRTIISSALDRIAPIARRRGMRVSASFEAIESRLVAGDAFWLGCALRDLLARLIDGLPAGSTVELTGHAADKPVLVIRASAPSGFTALRRLSVERDLDLVTGVLTRYDASLGVRCWPDRRLALLRLSGRAYPHHAASAEAETLSESARLAAERLIERIRRAAAGTGNPALGGSGIG